MKRILTALLTLGLVFSLLSVPAFAADRTYRLDELGMRIAVPSDLVVFTRDMEANDPNLAALGLTRDGLLAPMLAGNCYLVAMDEAISYEIDVTMTESELQDFNLYSDAVLSSAGTAFESAYADEGITIENAEVYQNGQTKFIKLGLAQPTAEGDLYTLQYYTVYEGKAINIILRSYTGRISADRAAIAESMAASAVFDTAQQPTAQTEAFTYTDEESGMSFTVPANWVETPMNEPRKYLDVKFVSNLDQSLHIMFSSLDMFSDSYLEEVGVTEEEKQFMTRADLDQSLMKKADVAAMWNVSESEVSQVTLGGKEYFFADTVATGTAQGITISMPTTYLMRIENGYMYLFQFNDSGDSAYAQDFKALVSSAQYPVFEGSEPTGSWSLDLYRLLGQGPAAYLPVLLVSFAVTLAAYSAFPLLLAKMRRKTIAKWKYNLLCYGFNFLVMFLFIVINESASSGGPYFIWTSIFSAVGTGMLKKRGVLAGYQRVESAKPAAPPAGGARVVNEADVPDTPAPAAVQPGERPQLRFCRRCGCELVKESRFCSRCGAPVTPERPE